MAIQRVFSSHAKSSAMLVSLAVHGILIAVAVTFVAVSVVPKEEPAFEVIKVKRPKMPPKKIKVPVDVKKRKPKPRLRKRFVSTKQTFTEIQMPEITGVSGGLGNMGGDGFGSLGFGVDFDVSFFGSEGGGQHVVFVIDYSLSMRGEKDKIMRREAARVISELSRGTEFGVIFFAGPAWPASEGFEKYASDWVRSEYRPGAGPSIRPKDWSALPVVEYKVVSKDNCKNMVKVIEKTALVGGGTMYDCPLYMALSMDPAPDTIFFITDGECDPQRGIISFRKMIDQLKAAEKKIPIVHTVGFGISENDQLTEIARLTEGTSNFLTVDDYISRYGPGKSRRRKLDPMFNTQRIETVPAEEYPIEFSL